MERQKPQFIFVLGGPGSGKGTQCEKMIEKFKFHHLSTGDLLRASTKEDNELSRQVKQKMEEGAMVSSDLLIQLIIQEVERKQNRGIFLLDGFPRNKENIDVWQKMMSDRSEIKFLLYFECSNQCMVERLNKRSLTSGRVDDNAETIKKRIKTFEEETKPILEEYSHMLEKVNAERGINEIFADAEIIMKKYNLTTKMIDIQYPDPINLLKEKADNYLREHRIIELFEDLCTSLSFKQPENVNQFLIEELQQKQKQGFKTGLYASDELKNIFMLFDLERKGSISKQSCIEALQTLANSQFQFEQAQSDKIPEQVNESQFIQLCNDILGLK